MNKLILFALLLITACSTPTTNTKFKNPLFYQPMEARAKSVLNTQLTPTSTTILESGEILKCELLADNETDILMKCIYIDKIDASEIILYSRFVTTGISENQKYCFVREEFYNFLPPSKESLFGWGSYALESLTNGCGPINPDATPYI